MAISTRRSEEWQAGEWQLGAYRGKQTRTGNSLGFRFDAALFKSHPEFSGEVAAHVIAPGRMLVTAVEPRSDERDAVMESFLAFLSNDIAKEPGAVKPRDPGAAEFRQENTLGADNRHWFRAKFHERYRLFYRFSSKEKVIVFAWVNGDGTLRKADSKTDPYAIFRGMLEAGDPPESMRELLAAASSLEAEAGRRSRL